MLHAPHTHEDGHVDSVAGLLERTRVRGEASLAFFARRVLGLRSLNEARLHELQAGAPARSAHERFALRRWHEARGAAA